MSDKMLGAIIIGICVGVPLLLILGWVRWRRGENPDTRTACLALTSLLLATASALLAIATMLVALLIGGFSYNNGLLILIELCGVLLSLIGILVGFCGVWGRSTIRWHGLICAIGTLFFWLAQFSGE